MIQQIRTPADMRMQNLVSQIALSVREAIRRELDGLDAPSETEQMLKEKVVAAISPYLFAFTRCGKHAICTEGIQSEGLHHDDHIYILILPENVQLLIDRMADTVQDSVRLVLDPSTAEALDQRVRDCLQRNFVRYVYSNPVCGTNHICRGSFPINPWK